VIHRADEEANMPYLDHSAQVTGVVLLMFFLPGLIIAVAAIWTSARARITGIDALKVYAERGQEPPASLLKAIRPGVPAPPRPLRGELLSQFAASIALGAGAAGFAWWRWSVQDGRSDPMMIVAIILVIVSIGAAAFQLVAALTTRDGD
jgi:hypothetical protein